MAPGTVVWPPSLAAVSALWLDYARGGPVAIGLLDSEHRVYTALWQRLWASLTPSVQVRLQLASAPPCVSVGCVG